MKILTAQEIRSWDEYTIQHEPIRSVDLMERAATRCTEWILKNYRDTDSFAIFCGKGNNGGDGLAIARMLLENNLAVSIYILEFGHIGTDDFQTNLARLHQLQHAAIHFLQTEKTFHPFPPGQVIIDALFGSGLDRAIEGVTEKLVAHINNSGCEIISIDIPSGLFTDRSSKGSSIIRATHTLSFQCYKPAFLYAENEEYTGKIHILDIHLHPAYYNNLHSQSKLVDSELIRSLYKPRKNFSHKGNFGHALLVAGSYGKMGAGVLSAKACLRSGVGLLTCHIPKCGYTILQTTVPEAMVTVDKHAELNTNIEDDLTRYQAIGIGPGIGTASETKAMLCEILGTYQRPVVIDADALNIIASEKTLLKLIPPGSILTPHPREFERLFGKTMNDFERAGLAVQKAGELKCVIVLKGHRTLVAAVEGLPRDEDNAVQSFFNSTGNPGMATAGSGDVLTGIITGLLAQGYRSPEAAILGVYIHGFAGDIAASSYSPEAMIAGDIPEFLYASFKKIFPTGTI